MNVLPLNFADFLRAFHSYSWWRIAVEWLLIGAVVYWVVSFLRGTRGARLLKGILVLLIALYVIVTLVAEPPLGLQRIGYLYGKLLPVVSVGIVVVFQPELRRALMRLGEARIFQRFSAPLQDEVEAIVESCAYLSRRKFGGLIAIERDIPLGGLAENGTRLNADVTASLLNTIFFPNTTLHDLGVIISQGRIMWANVQFPIAEVGDVDAGLGARHRAAVGLSQETDALIVVVSEQTGDISVAERGVLTRKITTDRLREILNQQMGKGGGQEGRETFRGGDSRRAAA
jgi:diadenylate cyclase